MGKLRASFLVTRPEWEGAAGGEGTHSLPQDPELCFLPETATVLVQGKVLGWYPHPCRVPSLVQGGPGPRPQPFIVG